MSEFWETTDRAYCYNCEYFVTGLMSGEKPIGYVGMCINAKNSKSRTEADDMCQRYACADWAKKKEG